MIKFTDGNLVNPNIYNSINDLEKLDFNLIYHITWFEPQDRDKIIHARHSEILVKDRLSLKGNLKMLIVRSEAEKEMLLYRMSKDLRGFYQNKIFIQPRTGIFINSWLYVNKVSIVDNVIILNWHSCDNLQKCQYKYNLKISIKNILTQTMRNLEKDNWYPIQNLMKISLPSEFRDEKIELSIFIDGKLVYIGGF